MSPGLPIPGLALTAALLLASPARAASGSACQEFSAVPASLQVAWVAPLGHRVGASSALEVVRVSDLRDAAREAGQPGRLLQMLGMMGRKVRPGRVERGWQVVVFDVEADWLCRPVEDVPAGQDQSGVRACDDAGSKALGGHRRGFTGCGYSLDTGASTRGLDVFRLDWETASTWGFCLMPLDRFMAGA